MLDPSYAGRYLGGRRPSSAVWIDLYQLGATDPNTDIDETLGALTDLVQAGKIRSFGASKVPASQIIEAQWTADRRGHGPFQASAQPVGSISLPRNSRVCGSTAQMTVPAVPRVQQHLVDVADR